MGNLKYGQLTCRYCAGYVKATITATTIALSDNGGSADTITDSGSGFVSAGFAVGDWAEISGATATANNAILPIIGVAAGTLTFPTGSLASSESAGNSITIRARARASIADMFRDAQIDVYSGVQPTTPDDAEAGTLLATFTGIRFGADTWDATNKWAYVDLAATITATISNSGTATWFRMRGGGAYDTGARTDRLRIDGSAGASSGDLLLPSTTFTQGAPTAISQCRIYHPQSSS